MSVYRQGKAVRIRVVSKGDVTSTEVTDAETGRPIEGVTAVEWRHEVGGLPEARITLLGVELDLETDRVVVVAPAATTPTESTTLRDEWHSYVPESA